MEKYEIGEHVLFHFELVDETSIDMCCVVVGQSEVYGEYIYLLQIDCEPPHPEVERWIQKLRIDAFTHEPNIDVGRCFAACYDYLQKDTAYYDGLAADQTYIDVLSVL